MATLGSSSILVQRQVYAKKPYQITSYLHG